MDHPSVEELAELVHRHFGDKGIEVSYDAEQGLGETQGAVFSVHNMAANLAHLDRSDWPEYVAWHFRHLGHGPPEIPLDYSKARKQLRVRLAPSAWADQVPWEEITRPVADDLHRVLMIAIEGGASNVLPEHLEAWGTDPEEVWDEARRNTMLDEPRERRALLKPTGETMTWIRGSWWSSTLLLDLGRYISPRHSRGALAMVPVRDALLFHEIVDDTIISSLKAMMDLGLRFHFDGPDPISPHVYWWHEGSISRLVALEDGRNRPVWGDEFREVLADLETASQPAAMN
jgi:hypothetical protein